MAQLQVSSMTRLDRPFCIAFTELFIVCAKRSLTVKEVLADTRWTVHFKRDMAAHTIVQFNVLWEAVQPVMLQDGVRDSLTWKWTNNGLLYPISLQH
jgi:hypothetical protein